MNNQFHPTLFFLFNVALLLKNSFVPILILSRFLMTAQLFSLCKRTDIAEFSLYSEGTETPRTSSKKNIDPGNKMNRVSEYYWNPGRTKSVGVSLLLIELK